MAGQHFPETGLNTNKIVRLVTVYLTGKPTYSPDRRSHTLLSNTSLIIWDIQTGGVPKNLKVATRTMFLQCGRWMGEQLAPSNQDRYADTRYAMNIHDVAPATSFPLAHSSQAYLWANNTSFRAVVTTEWDDRTCTLEISEVSPSSSR